MAERHAFEDPRFTPEAQARREREQTDQADGAAAYVEPPQRGCMKSCLTGCLWISLVLIIVGVVLGYWIAKNWRNWAADVGSDAIKQSLDASELPEAEKAEIGVQVDRLAAGFREGRISLEQMIEIVRRLAESPLATSLIVSVVDSKYLASSGLSDEEKESGRKTLRRFARGVIDNRIPEADRDATLEHLADKRDDGNWEIREQVTDEDLRAFLAAAQADADAAQIEDEPEVIDPSEELRLIVDEALGMPPAMPAEAADPAVGPEQPAEPADQPAPAE